ncbi:hypothetical protein L211DRAFT_837729 [Terfezia boudieri ATCC MYA-4762]|uniref:VLRF1 domain-containing protein n=1 Tax=Terfezia boudieri ATCC MYA-4762 TaxID=1051890 RepID=A0A3N4LS14_9PEZI|nr:hypothetical protein L211DRAFT_837729 [Terfezia boudieri ATCC MYA-4762]
MAHKEDLLQRPLYIYDLPEDLLSTLTAIDDAPTQSEPQPDPATRFNDIPATNCTICSFTAHTVDEQRIHVRSDLHKLNMKRKIRGQRILNEAEFERILADIDEAESISGSEDNSSESDEVSGEDGKKRRGVNPTSNTTKTHDVDEEKDEVSPKKGTHKTPLLWFRSSLLPPTVSLGIYRAILPAITTSPSEIPSHLAQKQLKPTPNLPQNPPHFFLCMIGGGHFAAMVISLLPTSPSHKSGERTATVLAHKTFHRYTTRRKQGGAQSANDNAKGNAHSAGSSLRRYNEAELNKDIRELLASWKEQWIDTAELLFIRAAGTSNRRTIFHYEGAALNSRDPRVRGFPFSTRRATQSELMRAFIELTRIKISRVSSDSLFSKQSFLEQPKPTTTTTPTAPGPKGSLKPTAQERLLLDHTTTLATLIRRSKVPPLLTYLTSNSLTANFTFYPPAQHFHAPTPLHLASSVNSAACVSALLIKANADPTIMSPEGKTPFDLAGDRATRTAFRLARGELGEDRFDWSKARVTTPLTPEDVRLRDEREATARLAKEEREKERRVREVARLKKEEEDRAVRERRNNALRTGGGGVMLGSSVGAAGGQRVRTGEDLGREREIVGMTPEMRMRLERERRARAAEARIRGIPGGGAGAGGGH